jgi:DNA-binding XRE family transcriptional regulator
MPRPRLPAPNRIAEFRRKRGLTQQQVAERVGTHWVTISRLENGRQDLKWEWVEKLATVLDVNPMDLMQRNRALAQVPVTGVITPGGSAEAFDLENLPKKLVYSGLFDDPQSFFLLVVGDGLGPFFHDGDLMRFTQAETEKYEDYIGRFCAIWDESDEFAGEEVFVGIMRRGREPGTVDLHNAGYPPIAGMKLKALAQATMVVMPEKGDSLPDASAKDTQLFNAIFEDGEPPRPPKAGPLTRPRKGLKKVEKGENTEQT